MTPAEVFKQAMKQAQAAVSRPVPRVLPDGNEVSAESRRRFMGGLQRVALPDIPLLPVPTSPRSPWYRRRCAECRHTFRIGDPAATCPRCGRIYHWNPVEGLDCLDVVFDNEEGRCICRGEGIPALPRISAGLVAPEQVAGFVRGLKDAWSAFGGQEPVVVTAELEGRLCAVCGHTVRLRESIVRCRCGNGPDGVCPAVIHLDFARRLYCWNDWNGGRGKSFCPLSGHKLPTAPGGR